MLTAGLVFLAEMSYISVDKSNVVVESVKKAEDGNDLIVRLYECHNKRSRVNMKVSGNIISCTECNLLEEQDIAVEFNGDNIKFEIKPFEIKTFKISL